MIRISNLVGGEFPIALSPPARFHTTISPRGRRIGAPVTALLPLLMLLPAAEAQTSQQFTCTSGQLIQNSPGSTFLYAFSDTSLSPSAQAEGVI